MSGIRHFGDIFVRRRSLQSSHDRSVTINFIFYCAFSANAVQGGGVIRASQLFLSPSPSSFSITVSASRESTTEEEKGRIQKSEGFSALVDKS